MIVAILQARMGSTRLPGKVLMPVLGKPMLALQIERIKRAKKVDKIILATSTENDDQAIVNLAKNLGVEYYQGSLENVLERFYQAAVPYQPNHVVRLTGDCPLSDPELIDAAITCHLNNNFDYTSNTLQPTFPDGLDVEVMTWQALSDAYHEARLPSEKEHVTPFIHQKPLRYQLGYFQNATDVSQLRWTVDEEKDFELVKNIYEALYTKNPAFRWQDALTFIQNNPELAIYNTQYQRNEGLTRSILKDKKYQEGET